MATVTIAHALFTWRENGDHRIAYHGDQVNVPDDIVERYRHYGAFEAAAVDEPEPDITEERTVAPEPAPATAVLAPSIDPNRPRNSAPRPAWEKYALDRGLDPDAVTDMSKDSIIAAVNALDAQPAQEKDI